MRYDFLIDTYETECIKVISAWSMFRDDDLPVRPNETDTRGRSFHEHMVHQCVSEDLWFRTMLDIDVVRRLRAWVMTRRMTHTAHHRGQQLALLRMLGRVEYSNYGPTADTGGLMQNHAPTIYAYPNVQALLEGEAAGGRKAELPRPSAKPVTERRNEQR